MGRKVDAESSCKIWHGKWMLNFVTILELKADAEPWKNLEGKAREP